MIRIVTDSTCDLPDDWHQRHDITVVPINIQFGSETFEDGVNIDQATFYRKIEESGTLPSTSQPSAGQFAEHYARLAQEGATDIVSLHVTAKLSGTYQSAQLARDMVADRVRVHTFDSACGSAGLGFMAVEGAQLAEAGQTVDEILVRLATLRQRMNILLSVKDLRYAQMSGRVGKLQSSLASLLNIKPIVVLEGGVIDVTEKVRTRSKAIGRMLGMLAERIGTASQVNLAVIHARAPEEGQILLDKARSIFDCRETFLADLTTSLVVHFGPGTLGLVAYCV